MKRIFTALAAVLLILVAMPRPAWAKSPTAKITISGGALTSPIEVTDLRIQSWDFNVWGGQFLDRAKGTAKEPPPGLRRYEVSFYTQFGDNGVRKRYVFYYYPNSATEAGYIYLPGEGETWYSLNVSAIVRDGQDGKWNYASPAWEALIKPVIAGAEAAPAKH